MNRLRGPSLNPLADNGVDCAHAAHNDEGNLSHIKQEKKKKNTMRTWCFFPPCSVRGKWIEVNLDGRKSWASYPKRLDVHKKKKEDEDGQTYNVRNVQQ